MNSDAAQAWGKACAVIVGLAHWKIHTNLSDQPATDESDEYGGTWCDPVYRCASITLYPARLEAIDMDAIGEDASAPQGLRAHFATHAEHVRHLMAHELAHIVTVPAHDAALDAAEGMKRRHRSAGMAQVDEAFEITVEHLADIIAPLLPLPPAAIGNK